MVVIVQVCVFGRSTGVPAHCPLQEQEPEHGHGFRGHPLGLEVLLQKQVLGTVTIGAKAPLATDAMGKKALATYSLASAEICVVDYRER